MTHKKQASPPPTGWKRFAARLPIRLYRMGLGGLLGKRFVLLNHVGRKSGKLRQVVLEVVDRNPATNTLYLASGWGKKSQWYQNIAKTPDVTVQLGWKKLRVRADMLSATDSGEMMVNYARRYPKLAAQLVSLIGHEPAKNDNDYRALGEQDILFVALRPRGVA